MHSDEEIPQQLCVSQPQSHGWLKMGLTGQMIQSAEPTALLDYFPQILGCQASELSLVWRTQAMGEHCGCVDHHAMGKL